MGQATTEGALTAAAKAMYREGSPFAVAVGDLLAFTDRHGVAAEGVDRIIRNVAEQVLVSGWPAATTEDPARRAYDEGYRVGRMRGRREAELEATTMMAALLQQVGGEVEIPESALVAMPSTVELYREDRPGGGILFTVRGAS